MGWFRFALPALLLLQAGLSFFSLLGDSVTYDELTHFTSGVSYWQTRDFRLDPENPPLVQYWATLPLLFIPHQPIPTDTAMWKGASQWDVARDWFCHRENGERLLVFGRMQMLLLNLALTVVVFGVARELFDSRAALLSAAAVALWPTMLAHGRLVTSDVPLALFTLLALWRVGVLLREPTVWRWVMAALACAALVLTKFSSVLVAPALVVIWILSCFTRSEFGVGHRGPMPQDRGGSRGTATQGAKSVPVRRLALRNTLLMVSLAFSTWVSIWAAYGTRFSMFVDDVEDITTLEDSDARLGVRRYWIQMLNVAAEKHDQVWLPFVVERLEAARVLPEAYLFGFTFTLHSAHSRSAFLMGRYSDEGWWYYFPLAFALKTPLPVQALLVGAVGLVGFRIVTSRRKRASAIGEAARDHRAPLIAGLLTFGCVYFAASLTSRLNIGERHLIPLYPLLCVAIGALSWSWYSRVGRWTSAALATWLAVETSFTFPHYIAYKSGLLWGRPLQEYLTDSNVDWGQDLKRVAQYAVEHSDETIHLSYFGRADPAAYVRASNFISHKPFEPQSTLGPGTYIVSATQQVGVYEPLVRPEAWHDPQVLLAYQELARLVQSEPPTDSPSQARVDHAAATKEYLRVRSCLLLSRLRWRKPDATIGKSMFVHRLSAEEANRLATLDSAAQPEVRKR